MDSTQQLTPATAKILVHHLDKTVEMLEAVEEAGPIMGPPDIRIAERLAIRILTRFFGWVTVQPGTLQRPVQ
jgi:hypothetical protein